MSTKNQTELLVLAVRQHLFV